MASLICWASGLLEVVMDKDIDPDKPGPVVLLTGTAGRLHSTMVAHGEYREQHKAFYVPGTQPVPKDEAEAARVQQNNMTQVIAFNKKLQRARLKQKGRRHLLAHDKGEDNAN